MRRKLLCPVILTLLLSCFCTLEANFAVASATITVPTDYSTIQDAVNNANVGDTVYVLKGIYYEHVVVDKAISVLGEDKEATIIDGGGMGSVVYVSSANVSISNFTIRNSGSGAQSSGISLNDVGYVNVTDNDLRNNHEGISLLNVTGSYMNGNNVSANFIGISILNSSADTLEHNTISNNNNFGIQVVNSNRTVLRLNSLSNNNCSLDLDHSNENSLEGNVVANSGRAGVLIRYSNRNTVSGNSISGSGQEGLRLDHAQGNVMSGNSVESSGLGLSLNISGGNTLRSNSLTGNLYNLHVTGLSLADFLLDIDSSNKADGKSVYYLVNQSNVLLDLQSPGYVGLVNSNNTTVRNAVLGHNGQGMLVAYSTNCTIDNCYVTSNIVGMLAYHASNTKVRDSDFVGSRQDGVDLAFSNFSLWYGNVISNSGGYGFHVDSSFGAFLDSNNVTSNALDGVYLIDSGNSTLRGNVVFGNLAGISMYTCSNSKTVRNSILNNTVGGLYASFSNNSSVENNVISLNGNNGIRIEESSFNTIVANDIERNGREGMFIHFSASASVSGNLVLGNLAGIQVLDSDGTILLGNNVSYNIGEGMTVSQSDGASVNSNVVVGNGYEGVISDRSRDARISGNTVAGNGHYGVWASFSDFNVIEYNNVSGNSWDGLYLGSCANCIVRGNVATFNDAGLRLFNSNDTLVDGNSFADNRDGIRIVSSNENVIEENQLTRSQNDGIYFSSSTGNSAVHNGFFNNAVQALVADSSDVVWNDVYPSGGNYWSNYTGVDFYSGPSQNVPGSDSIGDTPQVIDATNIDHYPLMTFLRLHDVAVSNATPSSLDAYVGWLVNVSAVARNNGNYVETFSVALRVNVTDVSVLSLNALSVGGVKTVAFKWNTSGLSPGSYYNLTVEAGPVVDETMLNNNVIVVGGYRLKMIGDVNGDRRINILDIAAIAISWGSRQGDPKYRTVYDMNQDGVINIIDISMAALNFDIRY